MSQTDEINGKADALMLEAQQLLEPHLGPATAKRVVECITSAAMLQTALAMGAAMGQK